MKAPSIFEILYQNKKVQVEVTGKSEPVFNVHLPTGMINLKLHTDASGTEHWWQLPYGETPLATELGEIIECCYIWPQYSKKSQR